MIVCFEPLKFITCTFFPFLFNLLLFAYVGRDPIWPLGNRAGQDYNLQLRLLPVIRDSTGRHKLLAHATLQKNTIEIWVENASK